MFKSRPSFQSCPVVGIAQGPFWALFMSGGRNHPASEIQIGKRQQREHLRGILGEAVITYLAIAELAFDDPEHVLDFGAHLAEPTIAGTLPGGQPVSRRGFLLHRLPLPLRAS